MRILTGATNEVVITHDEAIPQYDRRSLRHPPRLSASRRLSATSVGLRDMPDRVHGETGDAHDHEHRAAELKASVRNVGGGAAIAAPDPSSRMGG